MRNYIAEVDEWRERESTVAEARAARKASRRTNIRRMLAAVVALLIAVAVFRLGAATSGCLL